MKKRLLLALFTGNSCIAFAQTEMSSWTATGGGGVATPVVTDYQAIGINPSNLGWSARYEGKTFTLGFLEGSYSVHSQALTKPAIKDRLKISDLFNENEIPSLTYDEKAAAARDFAESATAINIDINWIGSAITTKAVGGFAFGIKERFQWYSRLSSSTSEMLFLGYNSDYYDQTFYVDGIDTIATTNPDSINYGTASIPNPISEILDDSRLSLTWMREYGFSYGLKVFGGENVSLYAGAGLKYLQGLGLVDIRKVNGNMQAYFALTPGLGIEYENSSFSNPSTAADSVGFSSVGSGFGFDLGLSAIINEKLKIGMAVTDIGSVTWDGNVYQVNNTLVVETDLNGMESYNFVTDLENLVGQDGVIGGEVVKERVTKLPTRIRAGASYRLHKKLEAGVDFIVPMNQEMGNLEKMVIGFGGIFKPVKIVKLSAGMVTGGHYETMVPVGITLAIPSGVWEFGVASRDALIFFTSSSPTLSLATGLLRFRF